MLKEITTASNRQAVGVVPVPAASVEALIARWLARRDQTHRNTAKDRAKLIKHVLPVWGRFRPGDITQANIRKFAEDMRMTLKPATVRYMVRLMSSFFSDLSEQGYVTHNVFKGLPKTTRALLNPGKNFRPFLADRTQVSALFKALPPPYNIAFALGARAGLRPGESRVLTWSDVELERKTISITKSIRGPTKSGDSRMVPMPSDLVSLLRAWKEENPGPLLLPPRKVRGLQSHLDEHTIGKRYHEARESLGISEEIDFYAATRHTFASWFVIDGGSIETLSKILGHGGVVITQRYLHLRPEMFGTQIESFGARL